MVAFSTESPSNTVIRKGRFPHQLLGAGSLQARIDDLTRPAKTPDNSSLPPAKGQKPNRDDKAARKGPRAGSIGRKGGGRELTADPDETVTARPTRCQYCQSAL